MKRLISGGFCVVYACALAAGPQQQGPVAVKTAKATAVEEVKRAIASQNLQAAAGSVGSEGAGRMLQYKILADGRLKTAKEFGDIVIRDSGDGFRLVRLRDVARVELGAERYNTTFKFNGQTGVMLAVYMLNTGNALKIFDEAQAVMKAVEPAMPDGMKWDVAFDTTASVRASMKEIVTTLFETFLLVVLITWVFLQSGRATLIPTVAIPVSSARTSGSCRRCSRTGTSVRARSTTSLPCRSASSRRRRTSRRRR